MKITVGICMNALFAQIDKYVHRRGDIDWFQV